MMGVYLLYLQMILGNKIIPLHINYISNPTIPTLTTFYSMAWHMMQYLHWNLITDEI